MQDLFSRPDVDSVVVRIFRIVLDFELKCLHYVCYRVL